MEAYLSYNNLKCYTKYLVKNYSASRNSSDGKVIICPYVFMSYWYLWKNITLVLTLSVVGLASIT